MFAGVTRSSSGWRSSIARCSGFIRSRGGSSAGYRYSPSSPATMPCWPVGTTRKTIRSICSMRRAPAGRERLNLAGVFMPGSALPQRIRRIMDDSRAERVSRTRVAAAVATCVVAAAIGTTAIPARALQQGATRMIVRPVQPRWVSPDSTDPQPVSLEWLDGGTSGRVQQVQSVITPDELRRYQRTAGGASSATNSSRGSGHAAIRPRARRRTNSRTNLLDESAMHGSGSPTRTARRRQASTPIGGVSI